MSGSDPTVVVEAPLRGEWVALHTPGERVPSHGTNYLGQRFAYDFIQSDPRSHLPYERGLWRHLLATLPADSFFCWDQPVYSVFEGVVTSTGEGWADHLRVNLVASLTSSLLHAPKPNGTDIRPLAGNYVIVEGKEAVAFYAHLRDGSVSVAVGQTLRSSEVIGRVGNSGNSTMPHLHFHLMDQPNIFRAAGVACAFRSYDRLERGSWIPAECGVPGKLERLRWPNASA